MEKIEAVTSNITDENVERLLELFPQVATEIENEVGEIERAIDYDALRDLLGDVAEAGRERYQFTWPGKREAKAEARRPIEKTLRPCTEESVNWDTTQNLYIEGDNLDALKILRETYAGKVKLIYIDPPYNTGHDFVYDDDFSITYAAYEDESGEFDEYGSRLVANLESNGRFHSNWCSMMYPRLLMARDLLKDDGLIAISISDDELDNLLKITNEVFQKENYVNTVSIVSKNTAGASGGGEDKRLKKNVEYLVLFAKSYKDLKPFNSAYTYTPISEMVEEYKKEGKSWKYTSVLLDPGEKIYVGSTADGEGNEIRIYKRINPEIQSIAQVSNKLDISESEVYDQYGEYIFQTTNAQSSIRTRIIEARESLGITDDLISIEYIPRSGKNKGSIYEQFYKGDQARLFVWLKDTSEIIDGVLYKRDALGTLWDLSGEMKNLTKEGNVVFANGKKPIKLLQNLLDLQTNDDDLIIDFFSGSASMAHAVLEQNAKTASSLRFIMVQIPEEIDASVDESENGKFKTICDLGKERIRRAGTKIVNELAESNAQLKLGEEPKPVPDIGFRVLKIDSSNMRDTHTNPQSTQQESLLGLIDNVKEGRTEEDLLFQVLPKFRIPYSASIEELNINGKKVFDVEDGLLLACFDVDVTTDVIEQIAKRKPSYAVMRDLSFKDDAAEANFEELFKTFSPHTIRRVI